MDEQGDRGCDGWVIASGGGEQGEADRQTFRRFLAVAGGRDARVLLIELGEGDEGGAAFETGLREAGAADVDRVGLAGGAELTAEGIEESVAAATGYYLMGGGPSAADSFIASPLGQRIVAQVRAGRALAASGAAAFFLGDHQVVGNGMNVPSPAKGVASLRGGMGLLSSTVVDASQGATRLVQLMTAVAQNPFYLGIGWDAGARVVFDPDGLIEACGDGAVTVVDGSSVGYSNYFALKHEEPVGLSGLRVHFLTNGMCFDLHQRAFVYPEIKKAQKRISAAAEARALSR